jgi:hypothetical protein
VCLFLTLLFLGPRAAIVVYWLGWPARWNAAFSTFIVPFIGFLFLPWTTLAYVLVAPGGVVGWDYLWICLGVVADLATHGGTGGYGQRHVRGPAYT